MAQVTTPVAEPMDENAMRQELEEMARQFPAILAEIRQDREDGERWLQRSLERRRQTQAVLDEIQELMRRL
jgi:hypothetical protein